MNFTKINYNKIPDEPIVDYTLPVANYVMRIVEVEEVDEDKYIKIYYDIAEGEWRDHYKTRKHSYQYAYPNKSISYKTAASQAVMKRFLAALEASGNMAAGRKFTVDGADDFDEDDFKGMRFGASLGKKEYEKKNGDGNGLKNYIYEIGSVEDARNGRIPVPADVWHLGQKKKPAATTAKAAAAEAVSKVADKFDDDEADLPF